MATSIPDHPPADNFSLEHFIKQTLADWGWQEVYTYSFVSEKLAGKSGLPLGKHLKLKNPLTDDWVYLRRSLIPSHLQVISQNADRKDIAIFEMANVYHPHNNHLPFEELHLTLTTTQPYPYLKGMVDALMAKLHLQTNIVPTAHNQAQIKVGPTTIGTLGQVTNQPYYFADILVAPLIEHSSTYPHFIPIITHPPIIEDMTFTLPPQTYLAQVLTAISKVSPLIHEVHLKDIFDQNYTFTISYRHPDKSLTDADIAPLRRKVVSILAKTFSADFKGKI